MLMVTCGTLVETCVMCGFQPRKRSTDGAFSMSEEDIAALPNPNMRYEHV